MRRIAVVMGTVAVAIVATAGSAWAHVTVQPSEAPAGSFSTLTFQVPNEEDDASTTKLVVTFPASQPVANARLQPVPGWTGVVEKKAPATPITDDEGEAISEVVSTITWTAATGGGIAPGEFQQFRVSLRLPTEGDSFALPTAQTYSDGTVVDWNQATPDGGPEPDYPQPTVTLTAEEGEGDGHGSTTETTVKAGDGSAAAAVGAAQDDVDSAKTMGTIGLVVGFVAILIAIAALVMARRKPL